MFVASPEYLLQLSSSKAFWCLPLLHTQSPNVKPYTLHLQPYTLNPTPFNLYPTPYTSHPGFRRFGSPLSGGGSDVHAMPRIPPPALLVTSLLVSPTPPHKILKSCP